MNLDIEILEAYLEKQYRGKVGEQSLFMKLVEEVGETAEILNIRPGRKAENGFETDEELGKKLADIIHYAVAIAAVNGLDLKNNIIEKDKKASVKYHREENLEVFIENYKLQKSFERIKNMEQLFDELQEAFAKNPRSIIENETLKSKFNFLTDYYENGLWLSDYKLDEEGKLPVDLKRGILSQDGYYNFLSEVENESNNSNGE